MHSLPTIDYSHLQKLGLFLGFNLEYAYRYLCQQLFEIPRSCANYRGHQFLLPDIWGVHLKHLMTEMRVTFDKDFKVIKPNLPRGFIFSLLLLRSYDLTLRPWMTGIWKIYTNPARGILDFCKQKFFGPSNASNKPLKWSSRTCQGGLFLVYFYFVPMT